MSFVFLFENILTFYFIYHYKCKLLQAKLVCRRVFLKIVLDFYYPTLDAIPLFVRRKYKKVYVLGYSVGATLAWLCSQTGLCDVSIGFYGSRIRDYLEIKPKCPVLLFFPSEEKSFDVDELIPQLNNVSNIQVEKLPGEHGFANRFSRNYNEQSSIRAYKKIQSCIKEASILNYKGEI